MLSFIARHVPSSYCITSRSHTPHLHGLVVALEEHLLIFVHPEVISTVNARYSLVSRASSHCRDSVKAGLWTLDWTMDCMEYGQPSSCGGKPGLGRVRPGTSYSSPPHIVQSLCGTLYKNDARSGM